MGDTRSRSRRSIGIAVRLQNPNGINILNELTQPRLVEGKPVFNVLIDHEFTVPRTRFHVDLGDRDKVFSILACSFAASE